MTVPTGGASVSATIANGGSATTATLPAASYYATAARGVSSWITALQAALNNASQGYPQTAAAIAAAIGYGTWTGGQGWLLNEASGNLVPVFGATTLTATSLTYGTPGPRGGIDKAIGYDAAGDNADGGNIFDVVAADDLIVAWIGYEGSAPGASLALISKFNSTGWTLQYGAGRFINFVAVRAGPTTDFTASIAIGSGSWYVGIAVIDRSTGKARVGIRAID